MTIHRTDIEKALDEMISNEEGMTFQGLAVVLTKLKWPEFIASERHNDLGLDAYVPAGLASDRTGKAIASSLTATLDKIKGDVEKFTKHVNDVRILAFATPKKVTREIEKKWADEIKKDYGIELIILSKEDIITDLLKPANISLCQSHLKIHVPVEPTAEEMIAKTREATAEILQTWLAHSRLVGRLKIDLQSVRIDKDDRQTEEILHLAQLSHELQEGRRIVLEAPAGRGKTTTLIQLAERMNQIVFLIDLPIWVGSNKEVLEFISQMPQFLSRGIDAVALAQIYNTVPCSFLLNGWNEISNSYSDKAVRALTDLERNFPKAGIIVATRTHHVKPPLPGSSRVQLLSLNRRQRIEYLNQVLASRAGELILQLENDRVLDDLTRTPLILAEVVNIFLSGATIPKTKAGILDAVIRLVEESDEHRDHLVRSPLLGNSRDFLSDLAVQMTKRGVVTMEETCARSVVNSVSRKLQADGQITTLHEPSEVLSVLCAHHVLERLEYPSAAFKFQHQQFQEWYVAAVLRKILLELVEKNDQNSNRSFIREYVNKPSWEEPIRMVAEEIGDLKNELPDAKKLVKGGKMLVEFALEVGPVFAAELARLCGSAVWGEVRNDVGERLRAWYQIDNDSHRRCALAGMIASGSEDFKDILLPLLTSDDQQVRLRAYRSFREFHVSSLGENWKQIIKTWKDDHQADFVGEVVHESYKADIAEEFARVDSNSKVRGVALSALEWTGVTEALNRVLDSYNDDALKEVLRKRILHEIPQEARPRAITIYNELLKEIDDPKERIRIRLSIVEIGGEFIIERIKEELTAWPSVKISDGDEMLVKSAIELIQKSDPDWVSRWLAERIIEGLLWRDLWTTFILGLPRDFKQNLFKRISNEALERNNSAIVSVLVATADADLAGDVFSRLCSLRIEIIHSHGKTTEIHWKIITQLQGLFRAMPSDVAISGMLNRLSSVFNPVEFRVAVELLGRIGDTSSDLKGQLAEDLRQGLRAYLKRGISSVLSQDDFNGSFKSELATALARVGYPEDMEDLNKLIQADIGRMRRGRDAWRKGDRGPMGNGGVMSYSNWHVRAVECLDPQGAEDTLLNVLSEPEYERDAAKALVRLARMNSSEAQHGFKKINYQILWKARSGRQEIYFYEDQRRRYANAIKQRIGAIKEQQSQSDKPDSFNGRLKTLACIIAILDGRDSVDLVMDIMALPGRWDGYARAEALEALLFNGAIIQADEALKVLNPIINQIIQPGEFYDQQNRFLLQRYFCLMPFIYPPSAGIARIKEIIATVQIPIYDLREMLVALGNSRCDEALDLLLELPDKYGRGLDQIKGEWIDAIAALNTSKSKQILMSFIDPSIELFKDQQTAHHDRLAKYIADITCDDSKVMYRVYELCKMEHSSVMRSLLAEVVSRIGTSEALVAGLSLIHDQTKPSIPYELSRGLERAFLGRQPYGGGYGYTIEPITSSEIRYRLFEMTLDDQYRKRSAWLLLGQIEAWRLEYGRPNNEPRHPSFNSGKPWPFFGKTNRNANEPE
ncbi:MAG: hypothetical protein HYV59_12635 [Planctomycetes bacterium]|nr:hypothetical protein [Planctomycetota bacterium]